MKQQRTSGIYTGKKEKITFDLPIVTYEENGLQVIYSPSLDVFGYDKTHAEARKSFTLTLEEFLLYTTHKKTLETVLKNMGWVVKKINNF